MAALKCLLFFVQACLIKNAFCLAAFGYDGIGCAGPLAGPYGIAGPYGACGAAGPYGAWGAAGAYGPYGLAGPYAGPLGYNAYGYETLEGCAAYGGAGVGNCFVGGELPVGGATAVAGQVPIIGGVEFAGAVPAAGAVTISGGCSCGCGAPYLY